MFLYQNHDFNNRYKILIKHIEDDIQETVNHALREDLGGIVDPNRDISSLILPKNKQATAYIINHTEGIFCGKRWIEEISIQLNNELNINWNVEDSQKISCNQVLFEVKGPARLILTAERTMLNFIQTLSGVATTVNRYINLLTNSRTKLLDTRKTIPGLRTALKYAVLCGGGLNHRIGLFDAFLIKENHIISNGSINNAIKKAISLYPTIPIEIEVENLLELHEAIHAGAHIVMLDNFSIKMIREAVIKVNKSVLLEVSGNITEKNILEISQTGVDYISIGALTKNIKALDISMRFNNF